MVVCAEFNLFYVRLIRNECCSAARLCVTFAAIGPDEILIGEQRTDINHRTFFSGISENYHIAIGCAVYLCVCHMSAQSFVVHMNS